MRRLPSLLLLTTAVGVAGCVYPPGSAPGPRPEYPVRGHVFVNGRPAAGAVVVFHPAHDPSGRAGPRPRAVVRDDGSFGLPTAELPGGAPAGNYVVTVVWQPGGVGEDRLGGRYADPAHARLTTAVLKGPNDLPPFHLDEPGRPGVTSP
ncbi:hypothetical protein [Urbifossiella limnaea]|uniref:Carboxypeptidase regulatory-like domain-containing protein n=1 Tax=Urbifossiella limnaea TaxID=2528023 RepID=A0A517Y1N4_9BACT|nr:hypothetical protein [Urbifossiella limnaea]QDU23681.1 hypothetical protein ETAA1_56860 [Urbifossiella limnaea]